MKNARKYLNSIKSQISFFNFKYFYILFKNFIKVTKTEIFICELIVTYYVLKQIPKFLEQAAKAFFQKINGDHHYENDNS